MKLKNMRFVRRAALARLSVGMVLQAGACDITQALALPVQIITQEAANLLSDSIFFFLDNLFVRITG